MKERSSQENGALGEQAAQTRSTLSSRPAFAMMVDHWEIFVRNDPALMMGFVLGMMSLSCWVVNGKGVI